MSPVQTIGLTVATEVQGNGVVANRVAPDCQTVDPTKQTDTATSNLFRRATGYLNLSREIALDGVELSNGKKVPKTDE